MARKAAADKNLKNGQRYAVESCIAGLQIAESLAQAEVMWLDTRCEDCQTTSASCFITLVDADGWQIERNGVQVRI